MHKVQTFVKPIFHYIGITCDLQAALKVKCNCRVKEMKRSPGGVVFAVDQTQCPTRKAPLRHLPKGTADWHRIVCTAHDIVLTPLLEQT